VINISCNSKTSINTLYNYIKEVIPVDIEPFYSPTRSGDILYSQLNNQKAITLLSWSPLSNLKEGLEITSSYYKNLFKD
jgi:UDP-glucose 4-epimerase